jgi:hypothetical protein
MPASAQRNWQRYDQKRWHQFMVDTDFLPSITEHRQPFGVKDAIRFIQEVARPFGIAHGSEKQGGQHQGVAQGGRHGRVGQLALQGGEGARPHGASDGLRPR